jgi:hypothetical protein
VVPPLGAVLLSRERPAGRGGGPARPSGSRSKPRPRVAVVVTERETCVRAYVITIDPQALRPGAWGQKAGSEFLQRHTGPLELVLGTLCMHLVSGSELLEALKAAGRPVSILLHSAESGSRLSQLSSRPLPRPRRAVPFDAKTVVEYLERIRRLTDAA